MFIYETNKLYDIDGLQPLTAIVFNKTPNGQTDLKPAETGDIVNVILDAGGEIVVEPEFEVGEKYVPFLDVFYAEGYGEEETYWAEISNGQSLDFTKEGDYRSDIELRIDTDADDWNIVSSNEKLHISTDSQIFIVNPTQQNQPTTITVSDTNGLSMSFGLSLGGAIE